MLASTQPQVHGHRRAADLLRLDTMPAFRLFGAFSSFNLFNETFQWSAFLFSAIAIILARGIRLIFKFQLTIARVLSDNQARWPAGLMPLLARSRSSSQRLAATMPAAASGKDHIWCRIRTNHECLCVSVVCARRAWSVALCVGGRFLEHVHLLRLWPSVGAMFTVSTRTPAWRC